MDDNAMLDTADTNQTISKAPTVSDGLSAEQIAFRQQIGKTLYVFAWVVEIFAVLIGLAIAWAMALGAQQEAQSAKVLEDGTTAPLQGSDYLNIMIAATPFLMVAIVEITKIPFVRAFYNSPSQFWKFVFGVVLVFLSFITFESAINGFERNFNALTFVIDSDKKSLVNVEEQIENLKGQRSSAAELTAESIENYYNTRVSEISEESNKQTVVLQNRISDLKATVQNEYIKGLKEEREDISAQRASLREERDAEIARINERRSSTTDRAEREIGVRRNALDSEIKSINQDIRLAQQRQAKELESAGIFTSKKEIRSRYKTEIDTLRSKQDTARRELANLSISSISADAAADFERSTQSIRSSYQQRLDTLQNKWNDLNREIAQSTAIREKDIDVSASGYRTEISDVEERRRQQLAEANSERETQFALFEKKQDRIASIDEELARRGEHRVELRDKINRKVGDNQIYRIAQWWYDAESAADLNRDDVLIVALIWFGSLAALVAFTGVFLALASEVIQSTDKYSQQSGGPFLKTKLANLTDSIRRMVVYRRRVQREPVIREVEVKKEVIVNKVQLTEVPKEVRIKEIVHVPLYTNDPELLKVQWDMDRFSDVIGEKPIDSETK